MIALLLALSSCSSGPSASPEEAFSTYIEALKVGDCYVIYDLDLEINKTLWSRQRYCDQVAKDRTPLGDWILSVTTFEVTDVDQNQDTTTVTVTVTGPDPMALPSALVEQLHRRDQEEASLIIQALNSQYKAGQISRRTSTKRFDLIETESGWKIADTHARIL